MDDDHPPPTSDRHPMSDSYSMRPQGVIRKKRDGGELSPGEVAFFVRGVVSGAWADYQSSALLMAV